MKLIKENEAIWAEKYRPQTTDDLIIDKENLNIIKEWVKEKTIPNIALVGITPGVGKTSLAKSLLNDINGELLYINASLENGIDVIRNKMMKYASNVSFENKTKAILLDEADGLSSASQDSLKAFIEEFSMTCRFILTANYKSRLIEPLINRCQVFDFDYIFNKHKNEIGNNILRRLKYILDNESIKYNEDDLKKIIKLNYPSIRAMIILLQKITTNRQLQAENVNTADVNEYKHLVEFLGKKEFLAYRREIKNIYDVKSFYEWCFHNVDILFTDSEDNIAKAIEIIYEFSRDINSGDIKDLEVSLSAFGAKMMIQNILFKGYESVF